MNIIRTAVGQENNVTVTEQGDFYNTRALKDACTHCPAQSVGFAKARQLVIHQDYPEGYIIKNHYDLDDEKPQDKKVRLMPGSASYKPKD